MIKHFSWWGVLMSLFFIGTSCSDDNDNKVREITSIRFLEVKSDFGEIVLTWLNPKTNELSHVDVYYKDEQGNDATYTVTDWNGDPSTGVSECEAQIPYLTQDSVLFTVVAYTKSGAESKPEMIKGVAYPTKSDYILNTVRVEPEVGGIAVFWINESALAVKVKVTYKDNAGKETSKIIETNTTGSELIKGVPSSLNDYSVEVIDEDEKVSTYAKKFSFYTFGSADVIKVNKTGWTISEFSSQEEIYEQPYYGYATNAIDDNLDSYWHSRHEGGSNWAWFPHTIGVDMGTVVSITRFSLVKRKSSTDAHKKHKFYTSFDNEHWFDWGEYNFDHTAASGQEEQFYDMDTFPAVGRYFRVVATEASEGGRPYTHIAEIYVYGVPHNQ
jgi:F5/8 type C domain.